MLEYASYTLHISESKVLNINVLNHCTNYWVVIETEAYLGHCQTFKMERFAKRIMPECSRATRNFSGQGRFRGTQTFR